MLVAGGLEKKLREPRLRYFVDLFYFISFFIGLYL